MKKIALFLALTALLLAAGCSTVPYTTKQHPEKYLFQMVSVEIHENLSEPYETSYNPVFEEFIKHPKATITEFPVVYVSIGETAVNDQTKTIPLAKTFTTQTDTNGVIRIIYEYENTKIGQYTEVTLTKMEKRLATCRVNIYKRSILDMHMTYQVAPATETRAPVTAELPILRGDGLETQISLSLGFWFGVGGLTTEKPETTDSGEEKRIRIKRFSFVRILPPSTEK